MKEARQIMAKIPVAKPPTPPAVEFRAAIEAAQREGVAPGDLTLRLTLRAEASLRRDRSLAVEDISYLDGAMMFLGVPVISGGVDASRLERNA